jgi:hypothetical protein
MRTARTLAAIVLLCAGGRGADHRSTPAMVQYTLNETPAMIESKLGPSTHSAWGRGYSVLEFGDDTSGHNDLGYEWTFYFEQPSGDLLSVTHNVFPPRSVAAFFPAAETRAHQHGSMTAISRSLPGDRVLIAVGMTKREDECAQIILVRRSALGRFYPWIAAGLK